MDRPKIAAVIPCYNVSQACVDVLRRTREHADIVIAVDDGSTDDTPQHLAGAPCRVVRLPVNQGKGVALRHGFQAALEDDQCAYVVTLDGDGQHRPEEIDSLLARAEQTGSDVVVGVRDVSAMPARSQFGNLMTRWFFRAQTGAPLPDTQTGFRLFRVSALRRLMPHVRWGRYETEMDMLFTALGMGMKATTAPVSTVYIDDNRLSSFRALRDSLRVFGVVIRYATGGLCAAGAELAVFSAVVLSRPGRYGWALLAGRSIGLLMHYLMSRFFAFRVRRPPTLGEVLRYALVAGVNLAASYGLLGLLIDLLRVPSVAAMVLTQVAMFLVTFVLLQRFAFGVRLGARADGFGFDKRRPAGRIARDAD